MMKAIAVYPGKANSTHLAELPKPALSDVPGGRGVLVRLLRCGVDGTDKEINAGEYGKAPEGCSFLVTGHENFGRVEAVGEHVTQRRLRVWRPRKAAVLGAGTIGLFATMIMRLRGLDVTTVGLTPKPYLNSDLIEALGARYLSTRDVPLREAATAYGPFDIIYEAT